MGLKASYEQGSTAALPFFERAVEIDPNFAIGLHRPELCVPNRGETQRPKGYARKAYELRGKVSERERLAIESGYYFRSYWRTGKGAADVRTLGAELSQGSHTACELGVIYTALGNPESRWT